MNEIKLKNILVIFVNASNIHTFYQFRVFKRNLFDGMKTTSELNESNDLYHITANTRLQERGLFLSDNLVIDFILLLM